MSKQALAMTLSLLGVIAMFAGQFDILASNVSMFLAMALFVIAGGVWAFYKPAGKG